jgi:predicted DNA binding CopG/RHH family protein
MTRHRRQLIITNETIRRQLEANMADKPEKIPGTDEAWDENGPLGNDFEYAQPLKEDDPSEIDAALELQLISIRLQKSLIEDFKAIAALRGVSYQPLMRQILNRFVECEKKLILKDRVREMQERIRKEKATQELPYPPQKKVA